MLSTCLACVVLWAFPLNNAEFDSSQATLFKGHILKTQNSGDRWQSPSGLSSDFPRLDSSDCSRYGSRYNYAECGGVREKRDAPQIQKASPVVAPPKANIPLKPVPSQATRPSSPVTQSIAIRDGTSKQPSRVSGLGALDRPPAQITTPQVTIASTTAEGVKKLVSQTLLLGFEGKQSGDASVSQMTIAIRDGLVGGVLIRSANVESFSQVQKLITQLVSAGHSFPLLVAAEQPGGAYTTFTDGQGFSAYASPRIISGDNQPYFAQLLYRDMAAELSTLGVNMNIGPSADICTEATPLLSTSCFSNDPRLVNVFATAFNYGHHERGVLTALQHTPYNEGLQSSSFYKTASAAILRELTKRQPSDALVIQIKSSDIVARQNLTGGASNSLTESIRSLGYNGALIFDLDFTSRGGPVRYGEAVVNALISGADIILLRDATNTKGDVTALIFEAVFDAVQSGKLSVARLEDAVSKIRLLKERLMKWHGDPRSALARQISAQPSAIP